MLFGVIGRSPMPLMLWERGRLPGECGAGEFLPSVLARSRPVGVNGRGTIALLTWGEAGRRMPGGGGPIGRPGGPFGGGPWGRGLTGSLERQVRGQTPCWERSRRMQRAWKQR